MRPCIKFLAMLVFLITSDVTEITADPCANQPNSRALLSKPCADVARFSCGDVSSLLSPCWSFLKGGASPSPDCCIGAENIADLTNSKGDEQKLCECLKAELPKIGNYDPQRLPMIDQKCDLDFYIPPVTGTTDCSK
ncbi:hypothetical protein HRI_001075300 [Hibiscus trionum]|uniref:Bifunctional inhibitor/plant lipid transfer protein/seed storage helical domain-containing protein n=1 Tax=Hibiscus trionum TaxID=183268 RepID=A0A9W7LSU1_HIBTR|nr:hypothetical protein HRI_001075300 [Hibiscus trionum]